VGSYEVNSEGYFGLAMSWDENTAFVVDTNNYELVILDTTDKHRPSLLGIYKDCDEISFNGVVLSEDEQTVYLTNTDYDEGVHVVDVSDRTNPTKISKLWQCNCEMEYIVLSPCNTFAYVSDTDNGEVVVFNITDPTNPDKLNEIDMCSPYGLAISSDGDILYIADQDVGFTTVDVSNWECLNIEDSWSDEGCGYWLVTVYDNTAYLTDTYEGIWILDVCDETDITLLANWMSYQPGNVALSADGTIMLVVDAFMNLGMEIVDVSDACDLHSLGSYRPDNGEYNRVAFGYANSGRYAYVTDGFTGNGLNVIGLAMPCDATYQWDWTYPRHKEYQDDLADGNNPLTTIMGLDSNRNVS
jgi:hypothetical protein